MTVAPPTQTAFGTLHVTSRLLLLDLIFCAFRGDVTAFDIACALIIVSCASCFSWQSYRDYDANLAAWLRARDVIAGEDVVKAAGERYLPRLDAQTDEEYAVYKHRAPSIKATSRRVTWA